MTDDELDHYGVADRIGPGTRVLDVGASVGQFALPCIERGAEVLAVEPLLANVCVLRERNVTVLPAAVGAFDGIGWLHEADPPAHETGSFVDWRRPAHGRWLPPVAVLTLARLVGGWHPDVVKVDVEGGEYGLFPLDAVTASLVPCLTVDTHEWTTGDEPRRPGVGHRASGPPYEADAFGRLLAGLAQTHEVTCLGPWAPGVTVLATR